MALSADDFSILDDLSSRLAGESVLAQAGRDDGLIPVFSLLSDCAQSCAAEPVLIAAIGAGLSGKSVKNGGSWMYVDRASHA